MNNEATPVFENENVQPDAEFAENQILASKNEGTSNTAEEVIEHTESPEDTENETAQKTSENEAMIEELKATVSSLQEKLRELEEIKNTQNRVLEEIGDFTALFPDIRLDELPESVWDSVKKGTSLAASYALYEKRRELEAYRISRINAENASRSVGKAGQNAASEYFSPDEVKKMSASEVHANYQKIKESMKKWI